MDLRRFDAVILDLDGVITRTAMVHARAWKQTFDHYLRERAEGTGARLEPFTIERDYRRYVDGKPRYDGVRSFLRSREIDLPEGESDDPPDRETVCGLGNRKNEVFLELLRSGGVEVYDDAVEQIDRWREKGLKTAVVSSSRNCREVLRNARLDDLFDFELDGNDAQRLGLEGKPAPDTFLEAARRLGAEPSRAIVIEDAAAGVEAGYRGGFGAVIGVARGGDTHALREAGAHAVVHDLRELEEVDIEPHGGSRVTPGWALEHPERILARLEGRELGLFLDYDGTLTPIVDRPQDASLSDDMRSLLCALSAHATVALISGRDRADVENMVGLEGIVYAGSHGFDISGPEGLEMQQEAARAALPELDRAEQELRTRTGAIEGVMVERKRFGVALHYRMAAERDRSKVEEIVDRIAMDHPRLRKMGGKKVFELQPEIPWNKGRALLWLIDALDLDLSRTFVMYLGDDVTDEDAFEVLRNRGIGLGVVVGRPVRATRASYFVRDQEEVKRLLRALLDPLEKRK